MDPQQQTTEQESRKAQVHLREKRLKSGAVSLYLDYYPPVPNPKKAGQLTRREFLEIHIQPDDTDAVRLEKWQRAKKIEIQRQRAYGTAPVKMDRSVNELRERTTLPEFMRGHAASSIDLKEGTREIWGMAATSFERFLVAKNHQPASSTLRTLDEAMIDEYRTYLLTEAKDTRKRSARWMSPERSEQRAQLLSRTTSALYLRTVLSALRIAQKKRYITEEITKGIDPITAEGRKLDYLTPDELQALINTPQDDDELRRACLFSAFTGLRWSDIEDLTFGDIELRDSTVWITKRIVKKRKSDTTKVLLPIDEQAVQYLVPANLRKVHKVRKDDGEPAPGLDSDLREALQSLAKFPEDRVFAPLRYSTALNPKLREWVAHAGITKKRIVFHCLRHTYAVLHINSGTDLFALSKLMTHSSTRVTETVYADILDGRLREAARNLPKFKTDQQ